MRKLYLKPGKKIGVCAPSDGNYEETDLRRLDNAKANLSKLGFDVKETGHVRVSELGRSADARTRANEVMNLFENHDVGVIFATKGGDFECEILPYIDFGKIAVHQKHFCGYSDNTCLTYSLATLLDMETVYTNNFNEFGMEHLHESLQTCLDLLQGKANEQHSYDAYESSYNDRVTGIEDYVLDGKTELKSMNGEEEFEVSGTLLGGCLEVVLQLMGTRFEDTKGFIKRHADSGILWYLESYALSGNAMSNAIWQLKEAGCFENARGIIFGRPCFYTADYGITYEDAVRGALSRAGLGNLPVVFGADVGHRAPSWTMINGRVATFSYKSGKGTLIYE